VSPLYAAKLFLESTGTSTKDGSITLFVKLDTESTTVNSLDGSIVLAGMKDQVLDIYTGGSAFTLWPNKPSLSGNIISFTGNTLTLSVHTITGHFPDYRQLFPKEFTTTVTLSKDELQKALLLTTFFNEQYSQVECVFTDSKCTLHSRSEKVGQVTHTISAKKEGDDIEMKYNNKFFLEVLPHIDGNILTCMFTTPTRPLFIQGKQDITFTYLLMPLNR
jgi:DNA polymerase III sliding clamp (beta) subunit (PCNA family)